MAQGEIPWYGYLLECEGSRIYIGITINPATRLLKHARGEGAKFTRAFPPTGRFRVFDLKTNSRAKAQAWEYLAKHASHQQKVDFLNGEGSDPWTLRRPDSTK